MAFLRFFKDTLWPTHPVRFFLRFCSKNTPPPTQPEVMLMALVMFRCRTGFVYRTAEMRSEKYVEWTNVGLLPNF